MKTYSGCHLEKGESVLPPEFHSRLNDLFNQIEREFEALYLDNLTCKSIFQFHDTILYCLESNHPVTNITII